MDLSEQRPGHGERHPWEIARVRALGAILHDRRARIDSILDIGCGDGFVGESLRARLDARVLVGIDLHLPDSACGVAAMDDHVVERYRSDHPVGERRFDLVLALDVIEHVADGRALLGEVVSRRATRGGLVLVTVPAFQTLFSDHDRTLRHYRRYSLPELRDVAAAAGLRPIDDGYLFASLLAPRAAALLRERIGLHQADHGVGSWQGPTWLTRLVASALSMDARASLAARRIGIRVPGLTAWALCSPR